VEIDTNLLDGVTPATERVVYLANTSWYGATGARAITEDEPRQTSAAGGCQAPAMDRLEGYVVAGLPIVTAFAGWVYGNGSWFRTRVIEPVMSGRVVFQSGKAGPSVSPIHVRDCARALVHLAERGEAGGRYFVVNTEPVRLHEFTDTFARLANRRPRVWRVPAALMRLLAGTVLAEYLRTDAVFSNIRLRGLGFRFEYPTLEDGLQQVLGALRE
jgi:nucleoside-diphosphate-sugar epimerase